MSPNTGAVYQDLEANPYSLGNGCVGFNNFDVFVGLVQCLQDNVAVFVSDLENVGHHQTEIHLVIFIVNKGLLEIQNNVNVLINIIGILFCRLPLFG